ncbi:MAG: DUF192 domain-containing protein [Chloroflexi bacterium]|nr:DUF192 domain-containing protein [Chloroflexota bacterium]
MAVAIVFSACEAVPPVTPVATVATAIPATIEYPPPAFVASQDCEGLQHGMLPLANLTISFGGTRDITVQVEVADETGERSQGLMCRESIPAGTGMLFTYDSDRSSGFWMFNTYAPIDILYLDQSGRVVDNIAMSPCTRGTNDDDEWRVRCATAANDYVPSGAWRNVLELPAGWLETQGFGGLAGQEIEVSWTSAAP